MHCQQSLLFFFATGRYDPKVVSNHLLGFTNVYNLANTTDKNARKIKRGHTHI